MRIPDAPAATQRSVIPRHEGSHFVGVSIGKERVAGGRWVWSYPGSVGEHPAGSNTPEVQEVQEVRSAVP